MTLLTFSQFNYLQPLGDILNPLWPTEKLYKIKLSVISIKMSGIFFKFKQKDIFLIHNNNYFNNNNNNITIRRE